MSDDLGRAPSVTGSRPADQAPTGLDRPGFDPSRNVPGTFAGKIRREMAELGMVPNPHSLAAAYAIWRYARPDGQVVLVGLTEGEAYALAWRAMEAAGLPNASGTYAREAPHDH